MNLDNADAANVAYPVTLRLYADRSGAAYEYIDVIAPRADILGA